MKRAICCLLTLMLAVSASCAVMSAQTTGNPLEPSYPYIPSLQTIPLQKGHAYGVNLRKFVNAQTPRGDCACTLVVTDSLDVHFKLDGFTYNRGEGSPFPSGESLLLLNLHRMSEDGQDEIVSRLPFLVDGSTMQTYISERHERRDSVIISLVPGEYTLEYRGFIDNMAVVPDTPPSGEWSSRGTVDDGLRPTGTGLTPETNSEMLMCSSALSLSVECIPLAEPGGSHGVNSWNSVTVLTSRDGSASSMMRTVTWLDDFGREESVHQVGASPSGKTLVSLTEYDGHGRVSREWLPAVTSSQEVLLPGRTIVYVDKYIRPEAVMSGSISSNGYDLAPYSETVYDGSPLERPYKEYGPGDAWRQADRHVLSQHVSNSALEGRLACHLLSVESSVSDTVISVSSTGLYPDGSLKVVSVTDEDGRENLVFTDRLGREVLSRQVTSDAGVVRYLDTYSIYDGLDHLLAVVPPALSSQLEAGRTLPSSELDRYAYLYVYDARERLCAKKLPGTGWVRMAYDDADRLVFSQDGEQRRRGESTFILYDRHGRECVTGICSHDIAALEMIPGVAVAEYMGGTGPLDGYVSSGVHLTSPQVMSAIYYDSYDFVNDFATGLPDSLSVYGGHIPCLAGRQTGSSMHEMGEAISGNRVWRLVRYDGLGRSSHAETSYPDGGWDMEDVQYDFLGSPVHRRLAHRKGPHAPSPTTTEDMSYTYDSSERLVEVTHSLDGSVPVLLMRNTYDDLGRLSGIQRGSSPYLSTSRSYNVRSWLTGLSGSLFSETLYYEGLRRPSLPSSMRRYGGDVSSMEWRASGDSGTRSYDYSYDGLGRLVSASYGENGSHVSGYGTSYSYDIMGNVLSLSREGDLSPFSKGTVDDLSMAYDGNRLLSVSDSAGNPSVTGTMDFRDGVSAGVEYSYDRNGAMTSDLNRGVTGISYNRAGRPARIEYAGGVETFSYLADGTKLARTVSRDGEPLSVTEYRDNLVYEGGSLKYVLVDGGMVSMEGRVPRYLYFLDDHLGSTRVVAAEDGTVAQVNHYYPFGMSYASRTMSSDLVPRPGSGVIDGPVIGRGHEIGEENDSLEAASFTTGQPYRFIGNELYADNGLGLYDFKARLYDPATGRFLSVDPLAENYAPFGAYGYCGGNPIVRFDSDGNVWHIIGGAAIGAGLDIAVQITTNVITGKRWNDIDGKSVLISAVSGAVGAGTVNKVKQMMALTSKSAVAAAEVLTDATVNGIESALDQAVSEKNVSLEKTVIDAGIGALSSTAGQGAKFLKQANGGNELKTLERQLDRAERLATDSSRASRQSNLNEARAKVENYGDKDKTIISSLTNYFFNIMDVKKD